MKNWVFSIVTVFMLGGLVHKTASAQHDEKALNVGFSIPEVALIDIEYLGSQTIEFELLPSSETGGSPVIRQRTNQELWINYSSALGRFSQHRSIVAQVTDGSLPQGLDLFVNATEYSGNGDGHTGVSAGKVKIGTDPRPVITGIGSAYTGNGIGNGHRLNFEVDISQMEKVMANESIDFTILYTLTDN
nr:hypothetical protein [uncultured Draconibacterium sp.]